MTASQKPQATILAPEAFAIEPIEGETIQDLSCRAYYKDGLGAKRLLEIRIPIADLVAAAISTGITCHIGMAKSVPIWAGVEVLDEGDINEVLEDRRDR